MKKSRIISALTMIAVVFAQLPVIFAASGYTNPNLESLFFVDKYGNTILEPDGMNVIPYVVLSKTEEASDMGGTVLVGTYTADGGLYSAQTIEVGAGSSVFNEKAHLLDRWTIAGEEMSYPEGGYARAFWWDSFESMTPNTPSNDDIMAAKSSWTGELVLPEPFKGLLAGVTITKDNGVRNYTHNAEPQSFYDWSSAETVYISAEGMADGLGGTAETAITMPCFEKNYNSGAYGSQRDFIITVMDDIYSGTPSDAIVVGTEGALGSGINLKSSINALIRSGSENGFTWMGQKHENASVSESSGIYKAALSSGTNVIPVNLNALDAYGMPLSYNLVSSLDDCKAQKGTYYQQENGTEVYFNLFEGENFQDISFFELLPKMITGRNYIGNLMFENIGFMPNAINDRYNGIVGGSYADTRIVFSDVSSIEALIIRLLCRVNIQYLYLTALMHTEHATDLIIMPKTTV